MRSGTEPSIVTRFDRLEVRVYPDRAALGAAAGDDVAAELRNLLGRKETVRVIFASAPSQNEFLDRLAETSDVDWSRVIAFHMDEYLGLAPDAPERFGRYLHDHLFDRVEPGAVHLIDSTQNAATEAERYARLIAAAPVDLVCLGIGENGHLAFNDPPVADFDDPLTVKRVALDLASRRQQVNDGCFPTFEAVPHDALTLTIPALLSGARLSCVVPGPTKTQAVARTLRGPISPSCPASVLRTHPNCTLYLDRDSYGALGETEGDESR